MSCFECFNFSIIFFIVFLVLIFLWYKLDKFRWIYFSIALLSLFISIIFFSAYLQPDLPRNIFDCEGPNIEGFCVNSSIGCEEGQIRHGDAFCKGSEYICCIDLN